MTPTIGRIVHYKTHDGAKLPAIVIAVVDHLNHLDLTVFGNNATLTAATNVEMAAGPDTAQPGQWWWPERIAG